MRFQSITAPIASI
jgi:chloride channel 7